MNACRKVTICYNTYIDRHEETKQAEIYQFFSGPLSHVMFLGECFGNYSWQIGQIRLSNEESSRANESKVTHFIFFQLLATVHSACFVSTLFRTLWQKQFSN